MTENTLTQEVVGIDKTGITLSKRNGTWKYDMSADELFNFSHVMKLLNERASEGIWNPLAFATFVRVNEKLKLRDFGL